MRTIRKILEPSGRIYKIHTLSPSRIKFAGLDNINLKDLPLNRKLLALKLHLEGAKEAIKVPSLKQ